MEGHILSPHPDLWSDIPELCFQPSQDAKWQCLQGGTALGSALFSFREWSAYPRAPLSDLNLAGPIILQHKTWFFDFQTWPYTLLPLNIHLQMNVPTNPPKPHLQPHILLLQQIPQPHALLTQQSSQPSCGPKQLPNAL